MKKELCVKLIIYKEYTEMYRQQNIEYTYDIIMYGSVL
jgi:hypothetical protein